MIPLTRCAGSPAWPDSYTRAASSAMVAAVPDRRLLEVDLGDDPRLGGRGCVGVARDQRAAGGEGAGVGGRLVVALLGDLTPDVDGQPGEDQHHDHGQGHDHQHLARRGAVGAHGQLTTIVAVARWRNRPPPSVESRPLMSGTTTSLW